MSEFSMEELVPLITEVIGEGGEFRLFPKGTSMRPLIRQGIDAVALVSLDRKPKKGDVLLYQRENGQYVLHRLMRVEKDGSLCFCGDNQRLLEHGLAREQVVAVVAAFFRGDKRLEASGVLMRLYAWLMTHTIGRNAVFRIRALRAKYIKRGR